MTDEFRTDGTVRLDREYVATADEVWDAWTNPERLARWLGAPAGPILGAAGPVRLDLGDGDDEWADVAVLAADAPRLLELSWSFPGLSGSVLRVEIVAADTADSDRMTVLLEHRGLGASAVGYGAGWQAYLDGGLARELGADVGPDGWDALFETALPAWRARAAEAQRTSSATG